MEINLFAEKMMSLYPLIARAISHHETDHLAQGKITIPQFWTLDYLYTHSSATMTEVSQYLKISRAATTGLMDRLLSQGLIMRKRPSGDRRVVRIHITPKGHGIIKNIRRHKHRSLVEIFSRISAQDRSDYVRILEQVVSIVSHA